MTDKRGRDIGTPTVIVHVREGTPEEIVRNRRNLELVLSMIESEKQGVPVKASLLD